MNGLKTTSILLTYLYLLDIHLVKCDLTGYKRIDIKELIKQKKNARPKVYVMYDKIPNDREPLENTVPNARIQKILDNIDDIENLHNIEFDGNNIPNIDKSKEYSNLQALIMRKGESSSSDSSISNSTSSSGENRANPKRTLLNFRKPKNNVTANGDNGEKTLGSPDNQEWDADVIKKNITLRFGGSCNKGASKSCVTACKGVLKNVCHEFRCSSGMKNRFKHECKTNCRKRFNVT